MRIPVFLLIILSGALWLNSCDAPHDNPLDPGNPDSRLYIIIMRTFYYISKQNNPLDLFKITIILIPVLGEFRNQLKIKVSLLPDSL
jgi:hypothetical protein